MSVLPFRRKKPTRLPFVDSPDDAINVAREMVEKSRRWWQTYAVPRVTEPLANRGQDEMTRQEFIDGYCERSDLNDCKTAEGYTFEEYVFVAIPCACEDETCEGWAMVRAEHATEHMKMYGPREADPGEPA